MDIHPPERPIRSLAEFGIHILTVTIGILIALALDALLTTHREAVLLRHTDADFRDEIGRNRRDMLADQATLNTLQHQIEALIGYAEMRIAGKPASMPPVFGPRGFVLPTSAAWETAIATQALVHMPFAESRAIAAAYSAQVPFSEMQQRAESQWFELAGIGDPSTLDLPELRAALPKITIAYAFVRSVEVVERSLIKEYDAALKVIPERS